MKLSADHGGEYMNKTEDIDFLIKMLRYWTNRKRIHYNDEKLSSVYYYCWGQQEAYKDIIKTSIGRV
jgi:hypothetical protein